mmetsp:Transcript_27356/g.87646  ORF Transcript_27356/g.87646 Transcript_27356/m.87646 type:complete len:208 (-) Transcript_27356:393-1016(-)
MLGTKSRWPGASRSVTLRDGVVKWPIATSTVTPRARSLSRSSSSQAQEKEPLPISLAARSFLCTCLSSTAPRRCSNRPIIVLLPASTCPRTTRWMRSSPPPTPDDPASTARLRAFSSGANSDRARTGASAGFLGKDGTPPGPAAVPPPSEIDPSSSAGEMGVGLGAGPPIAGPLAFWAWAAWTTSSGEGEEKSKWAAVPILGAGATG